MEASSLSRSKRGRKPVLTPEHCLKIADCLEAGLTVRATLAVLDLAKTTYYRWRKRGWNCGTPVPKLKKITGDLRSLRTRQGLVVLAIHTGFCTKEDLQLRTGLKEWVLRQTLTTLLDEGLIVRRQQAKPGAASPYLYFLK